LRKWTETDLLAEVWSLLVELSDELDWVDWDRLTADGTFCRAKNGGQVVGRGRKGTSTTALVLMDGRQTPLGVPALSRHGGIPLGQCGTHGFRCLAGGTLIQARKFHLAVLASQCKAPGNDLFGRIRSGYESQNA
jgi:hypothetical protein